MLSMDYETENKQATPVNSDASKTQPSRHIQVNLSKEYFASLLNQEESASSIADVGNEEPSANVQLGDVELGVTPITNDASPMKGIIKHNSELQTQSGDGILSGNNESPQSQRSTSSSTRSPKSPKSPKKVRISEPYQDKQFSSSHTIAEMDGLRTQLRHMIQLTQLQNSSQDSQHEMKKSHIFQRDVAAEDGNMSALKSRELFEDDASFRGVMPYTSPPLEMDEHGILHGIETGHLSGMEKAAYIYTSPPTDRSLIFENSLLKENLEKEKQRRKHCEDQVQNLQRKILEMQQQLAVAVATDRKKAIMIEQLDKTLANIVSGWKKQDSEKIQLNQKLREENKSLRKSQNKQQELLGQFEKELAHAVESLTKEQSKTKAAEQDKEDQLKQHEQQREEAWRKFQEEKEISSRLREDIQRFELENSDLIKQLRELEDGHEEERTAWRDVRNELSEEMAIEKSRLREEIEKLQQSLTASQNETQDAKMRSNDLASDAQNVKMELDTVMREKETLKVQAALLEAKIETLKVKQESETRALLEEEFNKRINTIQDEIMRTESQLKETHKEQILELNQRHKEDLELQLKSFQEELSKREVQAQKIIEDFEIKLSDAQNEILELGSSKAKLESQRKELTRRLQSLMQQHIQEAVSLLSTENGSHAQKLVSGQIAEALSHQVHDPPDDESVISDVQRDNFRDHNPFSSTFTDVHDYLSTTKSSLANSRSSQQRSAMIPSAWSANAVKAGETSKRGHNLVPISAIRADESANDILRRPSQPLYNDRALPVYGQETWNRHLKAHESNDNMLLREQRLQAGLQDLSDKLRRNDLYSVDAPHQSSVGDKRQEYRTYEEQVSQKSQWDEMQQLLRSKLDEVKEFGLRAKDEDEDSIQKQGLPRENIERIGRLAEETVEVDERDIALTSLIKKLLKMSPGNTVDDDNDYEEDLLQEQGVSYNVNREDIREPTISRNLDYLPVGSDSVSKDLIEGNLKTPPRPNRSSSAPAFKKSVLRERPLKSSFEQQQIDQEDKVLPARKAPQNALESQLGSTDDARKQLLSLMRALGIEDDGSVKHDNKVLPPGETSQSQDKRRPRGNSVQSNTRKSSRPTGSSLPGKSHPQPKLKQKIPDDMLSRLQKVYGNPERQPIDVHTSDQQSKAHMPRQVHMSRGTSSHQTKQTRPKEQKKIQSNAKQGITAWK